MGGMKRRDVPRHRQSTALRLRGVLKMSTSRFCRNVCVSLPIVLGAFVSTVYGQAPRVYEPVTRSVITLDDPGVPEVASAAAGRPSSRLSESTRQFGSARVGESNEIQTLTLRF